MKGSGRGAGRRLDSRASWAELASGAELLAADDVQVKMLFKTKRAEAKCSTCGEYFNCDITNISEEIDVYSEWIDACEKVNG